MDEVFTDYTSLKSMDEVFTDYKSLKSMDEVFSVLNSIEVHGCSILRFIHH